MSRIFFGMDPGKSGFIFAYDGKEFKSYEMPHHKTETGELLKSGKSKTKEEFHIGGFPDLIYQIKKDFPEGPYIAAIEEVGGRGGWSATNNFNFGFVAGLQRMIFEMLRAEIIMVRPAKWQSVVRKGYDIKKIPSSTGKTMIVDAKQMAEYIVTKEFPNIDFRKSSKAKNNHDGKIDAFLILQYLIRTYKY